MIDRDELLGILKEMLMEMEGKRSYPVRKNEANVGKLYLMVGNALRKYEVRRPDPISDSRLKAIKKFASYRPYKPMSWGRQK